MPGPTGGTAETLGAGPGRPAGGGGGIGEHSPMTVSLSPSSSLRHPGASTGHRHRGPLARQFRVAKRPVWGRSLFFISFFFSPYPDFAFRPGACAPPLAPPRSTHGPGAMPPSSPVPPTAGATGYRPGDNDLTGALQRDFISSAFFPSACSLEQDGT